MHSQPQDEFVKISIIFLALFWVSGGLIYLVVRFLSPEIITSPPRWAIMLFLLAWPICCLVTALQLKDHPLINRWWKN